MTSTWTMKSLAGTKLGNERHGTGPKTVLTKATGQVQSGAAGPGRYFQPADHQETPAAGDQGR